MAEAKGLSTPVKMKSELADLVGASSLPRTEITKKIWDYIKANKLQTKTVNGKAENAGKYIVCDAKLHPIFKNTKSTSKSGKLTDLTNLKARKLRAFLFLWLTNLVLKVAYKNQFYKYLIDIGQLASYK